MGRRFYRAPALVVAGRSSAAMASKVAIDLSRNGRPYTADRVTLQWASGALQTLARMRRLVASR